MVYTVALISGSLRKQSTNTGLLRAITDTKDSRYNFIWIDIHDFPVFNEDIEAKGYPPAVQKAREIVGKADGIIFGVAEYNFTISAPLKNAYDWLSREDANKFCPVTEKPIALVSSAAAVAGQNAQNHFKHSVSYRKLKVLEPSEAAKIGINRFNGQFFDENGNLIDQANLQKIPVLLNEFAQFLEKNKK